MQLEKWSWLIVPSFEKKKNLAMIYMKDLFQIVYIANKLLKHKNRD